MIGHNSVVRFFTADLHFGHANIIGYCDRPFNTVDEMNDALVTNWNATVRDDDEVWVLGDVAMGRIDESLALVKELHGRKVLVCGNHDRCWHGNAKHRDEWEVRYRDAGFDEILQGTIPLRIASHDVIASHFPYVGDSHDEPRFVQFRPHDNGSWLLHGHVHTTWQVDERQINVGVDVWNFAPVDEPTLVAIIDRGVAA